MSKVKIMPVRKRITPKYPDQYSTQLNHLLLANKPVRWNAAPVAGTVLSAVVMLGLAGCNYIGTTTTGNDYGTPTSGVPAPPPIIPFFEHGDGIGVYGCVAVAAPVFLSEDDAFAVIKDEFEKLNLTVRQSGFTITNIQIPKFNPYYSADNNNNSMQTKEGTLVFDFAVENRNIVMEFISNDDMRSWEFVEPDTDGNTIWSSVSNYNYKEAARTLNTSLNHTSYDTVHGVFYDPAESVVSKDDQKKTYEQLEEEARQRAFDALREQVRDFLAWLSAQGII